MDKDKYVVARARQLLKELEHKGSLKETILIRCRRGSWGRT